MYIRTTRVQYAAQRDVYTVPAATRHIAATLTIALLLAFRVSIQSQQHCINMTVDYGHCCVIDYSNVVQHIPGAAD
jgi:hypothetical protein